MPRLPKPKPRPRPAFKTTISRIKGPQKKHSSLWLGTRRNLPLRSLPLFMISKKAGSVGKGRKARVYKKGGTVKRYKKGGAAKKRRKG